jgi:uncharacterized membrane protein YccC
MWTRLARAMRRESERIAIIQGLRAAVATVGPLIAGDLLGTPGAFSFSALGGFQTTLVDPGGPYRLRAAAMLAVILGGGVACAIGSAAGQWFWISIPLTFAAAVLSGLVRAYGSAGASVGLINLVVYLIALASPLGPRVDSLHRGMLFAAGGVGAMALALLLWPFQPLRPARRAIASVWRMLGARALTDAERLPAADHGTSAWFAREVPSTAAIRAEIETAAQEMAAIRGARDGASARGEALLATLAAADRTFGVMVGLPEALEAMHETGDTPAAQEAARALRAAADDAESIARVVMGQPAGKDTSMPMEATAILGRLRDELTVARQVADGIDTSITGSARVGPPRREAKENPLGPMLAALGPRSLVARHALRLAVGVTAAHILSTMLGLRRGYWMSVTTAAILQPYAGATAHRALQRVIGTVIGGLVAGVLTWAVHGTVAVAIVLTILCVLTLAVRPIGYGYFTLFLTPLFVIIAEGTRSEPHLIFARLLNTVLGGALAFAAGALLWPDWEGDTLNDVIATAVDAVRNYIRAVLTGTDTAHAARRAAGLANSNAEVVLQRVLADGRRSDALAAAGLGMVTFLRRLTHTTSALESLGAGSIPEMAAAADDALAALAQSLRACTPPGPPPDLMAKVPRDTRSPAVAELLGYLARQIEVLYVSAESALPAAADAHRAQPAPA